MVDKTAIHIQLNPQNIRIFALITHGIINKVMEMNLSGKVVLVMGVGNDVGKTIVEKFSEYDASVGIMGLDMDELIKIETEINAKPGGNAFAIQGDISNADDLAHAVWQTVEVFGALHLAINNTDSINDLQNYLKTLMELY